MSAKTGLWSLNNIPSSDIDVPTKYRLEYLYMNHDQIQILIHECIYKLTIPYQTRLV